MEEVLRHKHLQMLDNLNNDCITKAENLYLENKIPECVSIKAKKRKNLKKIYFFLD